MNGHDPLYMQILANRPTMYSEPRQPMSRKQKLNTFLDNLMFGIGSAYSAAAQAPEGSKGQAGFGAGLMAPIQARRERIAEAQELEGIRDQQARRKLMTAQTEGMEAETAAYPERNRAYIDSLEAQIRANEARGAMVTVPHPEVEGEVLEIPADRYPEYLQEQRLMQARTRKERTLFGKKYNLTDKQYEDIVAEVIGTDIKIGKETDPRVTELKKQLKQFESDVQEGREKRVAESKEELKRDTIEIQRQNEVDRLQRQALKDINVAIARSHAEFYDPENPTEIPYITDLPWQERDARRKTGGGKAMDIKTATEYMRAASDALIQMPQFRGMDMTEIRAAAKSIAQLWATEDGWITEKEEEKK